jgi:hypothetical protein
MGEIGAFCRASSSVEFISSHSPVDPARLKTLLAKATIQYKSLDQLGSEAAEHAIESILNDIRGSTFQVEAGISLARGIYARLGECGNEVADARTVSSSGPSVLTFVDGLEFTYRLTEDDLVNVFSRFGSVTGVSISPDGSNAVVTLGSALQANVATTELNGKPLCGFPRSILRVMPYGWNSSGNTPASVVPLIRKYTCRFDIQIENDKDFHVARRIIGQKGCNMKRIVKQAGYDAKLRLRGRGSGFLEGSQKQESQEPLHLCVSCKEFEGYKSAVDQVDELLREIYREFKEYCMMKGQTYPENLRVIMQENPLLYQPGTLEVNVSPPLTPVEACNQWESLDVEQLIEARNEARRTCNFKEADRIRDILKSRGIGLMDEPGGRGRGTDVTSWRVWR